MKLIRTILTGVALVGGALSAYAQMGPLTIINQPFEATQVESQTKASRTQVATVKIARRTDGSIYREMANLSTGRVGFIEIQDVPHHQIIRLNVEKRMYVLQPAPLLKGNVDPLTTESSIKLMKPVGTVVLLADGSKVESLGMKSIAGLVGFGSRRTWSVAGDKTSGATKTFESWKNEELGVALWSRMQDPEHGEDNEFKIVEVNMGNPDPKLFEIPPGYTPKSCKQDEFAAVDGFIYMSVLAAGWLMGA